MLNEMMFERFLHACQDVKRHRERLAKPAIDGLVLSHVGPDLPNDALLSHIIAESLLKRIDRNLVESKNIYLEKFEISQIELFYLMCKGYPQVTEGHRVANELLSNALLDEKQGSIFEIGIGRGVQVCNLMSRLAEKGAKLETFDVIALEPDADNIARSAQAIAELQPKLPFKVRFHPLNKLVETMTETELSTAAAQGRGPIVMNSAYTLHHMMHPLGDTDLRTHVLARLQKAVQPRLLTLVEPNANHDTEALPKRLSACWEHFGTVFELIDRSDIDAAAKFSIKEKFFGREIRDIFGTSDAYRCERHERYESWLLRLAKAGFKPMSSKIDVDIHLPDYCSTRVGEGIVRLGYGALPLIAIFAFESSPQARAA